MRYTMIYVEPTAKEELDTMLVEDPTLEGVSSSMFVTRAIAAHKYFPSLEKVTEALLGADYCTDQTYGGSPCPDCVRDATQRAENVLNLFRRF